MSFEGLLTDVTGAAMLATGRPVHIAPAVSTDLSRVKAFYERLGATSSHYRFFGVRREIPERELRRMVTCELPNHVALLASIEDELIGIGEYFVVDNQDVNNKDVDNKDRAEVAFVVADDHHGEGVATLLLERLAVTARRSGLRQLVAHTLPDNHDMLLVFRTIGLTEQTHFEDGVVDVTLDLSTLDHLDLATEARRQETLLRCDQGYGSQ